MGEWIRIVTKQEVENVKSLIETVRGEVESEEGALWEVMGDIRSEATFKIVRKPDLSLLRHVDVSCCPDRLKIWFNLGGDSATFKYSKKLDPEIYQFLGFVDHVNSSDGNVGLIFSFKFPKDRGGEFSIHLRLNADGSVRIVINLPADCIFGTRNRLQEVIDDATIFQLEPQPVRSMGFRPAGVFDAGGVLKFMSEVLERVVRPGVSLKLQMWASFTREDENKEGADRWLAILLGYDFGIPLKWDFSMMLMEGDPPLGRENDGLLALCDKLIYLGTYEEGEGEVHVSLLVKPEGRRYLALHSKYPLLKSQMPPSLRRLEWKRG
jgi:hypothetical protein